MIEVEVKLKDGVSAPAGSAAHQVEILSKRMVSLQSAMTQATAVGNMSGLLKLGGTYQALGARMNALGGATQLKANADAGAAKKASDLAAKTQALAAKKRDAAAAASEAKMATSAAGAAAGAAAAAYAALGATMVLVTSNAYSFAASQKVLETQFTALGRGTSGQSVIAMLDDLATRLPYTKSLMSGWVKPLMQAGVTEVPRLTQAVKAMAASMAIVGEGGSSAVGSLVQDLDRASKMGTGISGLSGRLAAMGLSVEEVSRAAGLSVVSLRGMEARLDALGASRSRAGQLGNVIQDALIKKGIPAMRAAGATWESITGKLKDAALGLFTGIADTSGFKAFSLGLQRVVVLVSGVGSSAKGAKSGIVSMFDGLFSLFGRGIETAITWYLESKVAFLEFRLALLPVEIVARRVFKTLNEYGIIDNVFKGVAVVAGVMAAAVVLAAAPFLIMAAGATAAVAAIMSLIGLIPGAIKAFRAWANRNGDENKGKDALFKQGLNAVGGFVKGILAGEGEVKKAIHGLGEKSSGWMNESIDAHSPSRVFAKSGRNMTSGVVVGVKSGEGDVEQATRDMGKTAVAGFKPSAGGKAGAGQTINVMPGAFVINGAGQPQETKELLEETWVSFMERLNATQGGGP